MSISIEKDLRAKFGPARDQDPRPTCMAFAASDAHAAARPGWAPLSVEWAYYHALKREGTQPHEGVYLETMLDTLRGDGQPPEGRWPYIPSLFTDIANWQPPAGTRPILRRDNQRVAPTISDLVGHIDQDMPVLFIMSISDAFYQPDRHGLVSSAEALIPANVHALIAVGHGLLAAKRYILVRNSWGESWGLSGYAWLDESYLAPRLLGAAIMTGEL